MTNKKKVACFFTGGFTELNAMKMFIKKINSRYDYIQLCPAGERKNKDSIRSRVSTGINPHHSGLTQEALLNFVESTVDKDFFKKEEYQAIIIEDDKDDRFLSIDSNGYASINLDKWNYYQENLKTKLKDKGVTVPIVFFLAAPEVESWFIADYNNSFGIVYKNELQGDLNNFFSIVFKKHIEKEILTDRYMGSIEEYGFFNNTYKKLSQEIQTSMDEKPFFKEQTNLDEKLLSIRYSKKIQGEDMLSRIDPKKVLEYCTVFFRNSYYLLEKL